jgi:ribA/ribD-fused uncharacterized protein
METITFTKVKLQWGFFSNMSPHPVTYEGQVWRTTEALFQALRFPKNPTIQEAIRREKSPMTAKMVAKRERKERTIEPGSDQDLANMRLVLRLKIDQHPSLRKALLETGEATIIEDCSSRRASIWGARFVAGGWEGDNLLGKLWVELREQLKDHDRQRHLAGATGGTPA